MFKRPKVIFEDLSMQMWIGNWLHIFPSEYIPTNKYMSSLKLPNNLKLNVKGDNPIFTPIRLLKLKETKIKFEELLKNIGIDYNETCILKNFKKINGSFYTFDCHFVNSSDNVKMKIYPGTLYDFPAELIIESQNIAKTYTYSHFKNGKEKIELWSVGNKNPKNRNILHRFFSEDEASFYLYNNDYRLSLHIDNPKRPTSNDKHSFELKNEEQLKEYLSGLTFPIDVSVVYKKICEISEISMEKCPKFEMIVEKMTDENKQEITDEIVLERGKVREFSITRNGKIRTLYRNGNYLKEHDDVSKDNEYRNAYSFNPINYTNLPNLFDEISDDKTVNSVRTLKINN